MLFPKISSSSLFENFCNQNHSMKDPANNPNIKKLITEEWEQAWQYHLKDVKMDYKHPSKSIKPKKGKSGEREF